ncbi:hypothetical protein [Amycolatopsis anabasis]|uniref:hypothetical protein n=1 Tax=Amycolatopsis anabasis TaxID=1840409 RepID=UPI00131B863A|nr:hypothetical protein [Amycolatopsis anabasis]
MPSSVAPTRAETALRPVIRLLYLNLAISVVFAALTFLFEDSILDYQVATQPGATRQALADVLWIRPVSVLVVGILYFGIAKRLHLGRRRTYARVLIIAILGFAGLVFLVVSAQFPLWMRIGQVAQAAVLLALLFFVTRPQVRALFAKHTAKSAR